MQETKKKFNFNSLKEIMTMDLKDLKKLKLNSDNKSKNQSIFTKDINIKKPKKVVAFDIGYKNINIAVGKNEKNKLIIDRLLTIPTPENIVNDGNIIDRDILKEVIKYSLNEAKIKVENAICTTNSTKIINREIIVPKVNDDELDTVIKYEIQQYLPINLNDYILQHKILEQINDQFEGKEKYKVNVMTYPERIASEYYNLLDEMDLNPHALDVHYNSVNKLLNMASNINGKQNSKEGTVAFVDMGATSINVTIYKNGKLDFTRIIKSGGDNIDFALSRSMGMSIKSTESIKIEKCDLNNFNDNIEVNTIVKGVIDEWINDLARLLQFYRNKEKDNRIDKLYVYGGSSNIKGLIEIMEEKIQLEIEKIKHIDILQISNKNMDEPLEQYINVIGSIIRL